MAATRPLDRSLNLPFVATIQQQAVAKAEQQSTQAVELAPVVPVNHQEAQDRALETIIPHLFNMIASYNRGFVTPPLTTATEMRQWLADPLHEPLIHNVHTINLVHFDIPLIPDALRQFKNLKSFLFPCRGSPPVPSWLAEMTDLNYLYLDNIPLRQVPEAVRALTKLTELRMSGCGLTGLSDWFGELTELTKLFLENNEIQAVPPSFSNLRHLEKLNLSSNQLTQFPPVASCQKLQELNLSNNRIPTIPPWIGSLEALTHLDVLKNQVSSIPAEIEALRNLRDLRLNHNNLHEIPDAISRIPQLVWLGVGHNFLTTLPDSMKDLQMLDSLEIESNQFSEIPPCIGQIKTLSSLSAQDNQISCIPLFLLRLPDFSWFRIDNNRITDLPERLAGALWNPSEDAVTLKEIFLDGNPIRSVPYGVLYFEPNLMVKPPLLTEVKENILAQHQRELATPCTSALAKLYQANTRQAKEGWEGKSAELATLFASLSVPEQTQIVLLFNAQLEPPREDLAPDIDLFAQHSYLFYHAVRGTILETLSKLSEEDQVTVCRYACTTADSTPSDDHAWNEERARTNLPLLADALAWLREGD